VAADACGGQLLVWDHVLHYRARDPDALVALLTHADEEGSLLTCHTVSVTMAQLLVKGPFFEH
jgi:hypothetical protein